MAGTYHSTSDGRAELQSLWWFEFFRCDALSVRGATSLYSQPHPVGGHQGGHLLLICLSSLGIIVVLHLRHFVIPGATLGGREGW